MANLTRERWDEAVREHGKILEALTRRDGRRLRDLLQQHLEHKHQALLAASTAAAARAARAAPAGRRRSSSG